MDHVGPHRPREDFGSHCEFDGRWLKGKGNPQIIFFTFLIKENQSSDNLRAWERRCSSMRAREINLSFSKSRFIVPELLNPHFKVWLLLWPLALLPVSSASFTPTYRGVCLLFSLHIPELFHLFQKGDQDQLRESKFYFSRKRHMNFAWGSSIFNLVLYSVEKNEYYRRF